VAETANHLRRLERMLGVAIDTAQQEHLQGLVDGGAAEDEDLDFKKAHYQGPGASLEFGKDVASLANARGGALILGVDEKNRVAVGLTPVQLSDNRERTMHQWVAEKVVPAAAFTVHRVESETPDMGYYIVGVPRSNNRPHAVRQSDQDLRWPIRRGTLTHFMSESELAGAYRDRFAAAELSMDRLARTRRLGLSLLNPEAAWIAVSLVPLAGDRVQMSNTVVERWQQWAIARARESPPGFDGSGIQAGARFQRVSLQTWFEKGLASSFYGEVHLDGGAFFATPLSWGRTQESATDVSVDKLSILLVALLRFCAAHPADNLTLSGDAVVTVDIVAPGGGTVQLVHHNPMGFRDRIGSVTPAADESPSATVDISALAGDWSDVVLVARDLLAQIQSGYGAAEPPQIDQQGAIRVLFFEKGIQDPIRQWAANNEVPVSEATTTASG
jgi:hypothetical protein